MMTKTEAVEYMTDIMAKFVGYSGKVLPDDVTEKLKELRVLETDELPKTIYDTMFRNQELAAQLDRPCCQDTGVLQYLVKCGTRFPLIDFVESLLKEATVRATFDAPSATTAWRRLTNTTQVRMWERGPLPYFGRLFRSVIPVRFILIWLEEDVHCRERPWY